MDLSKLNLNCIDVPGWSGTTDPDGSPQSDSSSRHADSDSNSTNSPGRDKPQAGSSKRV